MLIKLIKEWLIGLPLHGEPISYNFKLYTTMPPNVTCTFAEWEAGCWIQNL